MYRFLLTSYSDWFVVECWSVRGNVGGVFLVVVGSCFKIGLNEYFIGL